VDRSLPGVVVTGASGFIGRHFLVNAVGKYRVFCLARRSRREAGIPEYRDQRWTQVDIAEWDTMREVVRCIKDHGGAEHVLHLAGYYDFHNMDHPQYDRTNVEGTRNVLKLARQVGASRFLFASSLAACEFPAGEDVLDEDAPADAPFAYARTKRQGEEMVRQHADFFAVSVLRLAAVFSDWCEYPPMYKLMETWLGPAWNRHVLGGRGESAVPYIHIQDVLRMIDVVIARSAELPRHRIYNVSPNHVTTHRQLFDMANRYFFGHAPSPVCLPRWLAGPGVWTRYQLGRLRGSPPFEAPWMTKYIDKQLRVDASRTHRELGWEPRERHDVSRRLLFMIENMKSQVGAWRQRNERALQRVAQRPNLIISNELNEICEELAQEIAAHLTHPDYRERYCRYHEMERDTLLWFITLVLQVLSTSIRTADRQLFLHYSRVIATRRLNEGFSEEQVNRFLMALCRFTETALLGREVLATLKQEVHDQVTLSFQLAVDGIADVFDGMIEKGGGLEDYGMGEIPRTSDGLALLVKRLSDVCEDALPPRLKATREQGNEKD
jgi:nucleoside-diphosphate-sugar epimerase